MSRRFFMTTDTRQFINAFSMEFDGVNDHLNCGDIANFDRLDSFSIGGWYKISASGSRTFMSRMLDSTSSGWLMFLSSGKWRFILRNTTTTNEIRVDTTASTYNDGLWHHLLLTYDGSSNASGVNIYIDGVVVAMTTAIDNLTASTQVVTNCRVGSRATDLHFSGKIDEPFIKDTELSSAEALLIGGGSPASLSVYSPYAWYRFTQTDINNWSTIKDYSDNNRNAQATNMVVGSIQGDVPV